MLHVSVYDFNSLRPHVGHKIICVVHKDRNREKNVAMKCADCDLVMMNFDHDELPGYDEMCIKQDDRYYFNIQISGCGNTLGEAWKFAVERFAADPGDPPVQIIEK